MMIGRLEAARDTQQQPVESGSISGAPKTARLYVFYQPITVCVLEASPRGDAPLLATAGAARLIRK